PLLCAGITTYSPLRHWQAGPGRRVAILGVGGLGHMGVKLAHAMEAETTVLSHSAGKAADAARLGADEFFATSDRATFRVLRNRFDLIICTVSVPLDLDAYMSLVRPGGTFCVVGLPSERYQVHPFTLTGGRRSLAGSNIGGIAETQEMLDFCAAHGLAADIELIGAPQINQAWDRVVRSDVRYRFVIDIATLG
ncbi:MAG: zinc-binding dehydrogenase, partial [Bifidobacteriaceae bacterium]|nr:zinc-binding dehydrogenase [Bifidobacteriaceae bacterium]